MHSTHDKDSFFPTREVPAGQLDTKRASWISPGARLDKQLWKRAAKNYPKIKNPKQKIRPVVGRSPTVPPTKRNT